MAYQSLVRSLAALAGGTRFTTIALLALALLFLQMRAAAETPNARTAMTH
ncbi:hypothetical protein [Rhodopila sp.]